ncbi:MAG: penicillin-binding protein 2 [Elusimicrobiota bacterium]
MKRTNKRITLVFYCVVLTAAALVLKLLQIQVWEHDRFEKFSSRQISKQEKAGTPRGFIYDRHKRILAMDVESLSFSAFPGEIKDVKGFSSKLGDCLNMPPAIISQKLNSGKNFVYIKRKFVPDKLLSESPDALKGFTSRMRELKKEGLIVDAEPCRYYPHKNITSQIVGVVGTDGAGLSGVEFMLDKFIKRSRAGDTGSTRRGIRADNYQNRINVSLTIDSTLQHIAAAEMEKIIEKYSPQKAFIIMQDPRTGEILAIVSWPWFDPNEHEFSTKDLKIPAIHDVFEPGSTFKIVSAASALDEGAFAEDDIIYCENGKYKFADRVINDHEKRDYLTFEGVFAYSSNIGFAKIGNKVGKERLYYWMRQFGFGAWTGINMAGEQKGLMLSPKSRGWTVVTTPNISYGQGVGVTGLQVINAYSCIANGGILYEPSIIKSVFDDGGNVLDAMGPREIRRALSPDIARRLRSLLVKAVGYGTGQQAQVKGYTVAGKTGTAQKIDPATRKYAADRHIASFCGFLPAKNPALVILVVIDEPKGNYWASEVACPSFREVAAKAMNYMKIPRKETPYEFTKISR